ncbi:proline--tRNA ligase [Nocardioides convexus]|uniref:proline--tRNA ligase n=1 Tax=Nocardioides convexus TaxID=2712224 RepID=UPI003101330D
MRMSTLFVRTLREDPSDAEVPSHRLLLRAGYIRRAAPGGYSWLPLGLRVLRKVEAVIREEMAAIGSQEVHFPALLPREPYEATNRWTEYGDGIFRLKDRKGADYLLGPTHEEMFTLLVKDLYGSYKDLPLSLFQIQTKYRDEARPRAGLLRGREFIMKDSYSFDVDDAGLDASYAAHRDAYVRIFDRLGFDYVIVKATAGAMGGSRSEEFLARAEVGEDTYVRCTKCDYAANVEAVEVRPPAPVAYDDVPAAHAENTPGTPTIDSLVAHLNAAFPRADRPWTAGDTLKNVLVVLKHPDGTREPLAIGLPGDREVDQKRLEGQARADRGRADGRGRAREAPRARQGLHRARRAGGGGRDGHPLPGRPPRQRGHPLGDRRRRRRAPRHRPGRRPRLHRRRHDRGRRGPRRRRLPESATAACWSPRAASRWATSSRLGRKYAEALDLKVLDENGKARHRHDGLLRRRCLPRRRGDRRGHAGRDRPVLAAGGRARRRARGRGGQGPGRLRGGGGARRGPRPRGRRRPLRRPRRQDQPRREVQGRRA